VEGLLITSPVAAPAAIARLAALAARSPGLIATVDHPVIALAICDAATAMGVTIDILIDVDPGIRRTGAASADAAVALAETIAGRPGLRYRGVQFYCGGQQHIEDFAARRSAITDRTAYLGQVLAALDDAGFPALIVSGGGTGSHVIDLELGMFTELQAGSYVLMDRQYLDCDLTDGAEPTFETALMLDARVVSANHDGLVTIDAGFKSLSTDGGSATVLRGAAPDTGFVFMGDEHAALVAPGISGRLRPGDPVTLVVPHCDPTVNLHDNYHVVSGDTLTAIWPIDARGRVR
jgi:3-hydroxy-D-aspartate aldolase